MNGIIGINSFYGLRTNYCTNNKKTSFKGIPNGRILKTYGMVLTAAGMLTLTSCNNKKQDVQSEDLKETVEKKNISSSSDYIEENKVKTYYHYYPRSNNMISSGDYDWSETVYPDGSIERDSAGYKITIAPDGERTVTKTKRNNKENTTTTTTEYNDGTKVIYIDSETIRPKEYVKDSITAENDLSDKIDTKTAVKDSTVTDSIKTQKQIYKYYNDKNILLYWHIEVTTSEQNDSTNVYDNQGRLILDCTKNEKFEYKNKRKTPYQSVIEIEGCKRYTIYKKDGSIKSIYFKASDGTVTKQEDIDFFIKY